MTCKIFCSISISWCPCSRIISEKRVQHGNQWIHCENTVQKLLFGANWYPNRWSNVMFSAAFNSCKSSCTSARFLMMYRSSTAGLQLKYFCFTDSKCHLPLWGICLLFFIICVHLLTCVWIKSLPMYWGSALEASLSNASYGNIRIRYGSSDFNIIHRW